MYFFLTFIGSALIKGGADNQFGHPTEWSRLLHPARLGGIRRLSVKNYVEIIMIFTESFALFGFEYGWNLLILTIPYTFSTLSGGASVNPKSAKIN